MLACPDCGPRASKFPPGIGTLDCPAGIGPVALNEGIGPGGPKPALLGGGVLEYPDGIPGCPLGIGPAVPKFPFGGDELQHPDGPVSIKPGAPKFPFGGGAFEHPDGMVPMKPGGGPAPQPPDDGMVAMGPEDASNPKLEPGSALENSVCA